MPTLSDRLQSLCDVIATVEWLIKCTVLIIVYHCVTGYSWSVGWCPSGRTVYRWIVRCLFSRHLLNYSVMPNGVWGSGCMLAIIACRVYMFLWMAIVIGLFFACSLMPLSCLKGYCVCVYNAFNCGCQGYILRDPLACTQALAMTVCNHLTLSLTSL